MAIGDGPQRLAQSGIEINGQACCLAPVSRRARPIGRQVQQGRRVLERGTPEGKIIGTGRLNAFELCGTRNDPASPNFSCARL